MEAGTSAKSHVLSQLKQYCHEFYKYHDFSTLRADCATLRGHKLFESVSKREVGNSLSNIKALSPVLPRFYDFSVSRNPFSKTKNLEICEINGLNFFNCESKCDLTNFTALIYDRKTAARRFDI